MQEQANKLTDIKGSVIAIKDAKEFENILATSKKPVLADFYSDYCGPCKIVGPYFSAYSKINASDYTFVKVNTEKLPDLSQKHKIRGIPAMIVFENGKETTRKVGSEEILSYMKSNLKPIDNN